MTQDSTSEPRKPNARSAAVTAGPNRAAARSYLRAAGMQDADFDKPMIAVVNTWSSVTPCNMHLDRLAAEGVKLPVHIGVAGPAKLQTLIKFAIACGVGPSLRVLQKRAMDVTKLLLPYEPTEFVAELAAHKAANPGFGIEQVHFFPLGGIKTNAQWVTENGGASGVPASATA